MENNSTPNSFLLQLEAALHEGLLPPKYLHILKQFYLGYKEAVRDKAVSTEKIFGTFLHLMKRQVTHPFTFEPFHRMQRSPIDYYQFSLDLVEPLINREHSSVSGLEHLRTLVQLLEKGDNVIFLANHQTEADPQAIASLLKDTYPQFVQQLIFVAGERVITDPLAIPASRGCNLLCIYSKRYIDHPPELKREKQLHNKKTMELMSALLGEGGKAVYVAPSGGRDRPNAQGVVEVAPFDPQSIEMFYLMAQRAGHPTHFFPLTLKTFALIPPPQTVQIELGEERIARCADIHIAFGPEIDMEHFPGSDLPDKHERRAARAHFIYHLVREAYTQLP